MRTPPPRTPSPYPAVALRASGPRAARDAVALHELRAAVSARPATAPHSPAPHLSGPAPHAPAPRPSGNSPLDSDPAPTIRRRTAAAWIGPQTSIPIAVPPAEHPQGSAERVVAYKEDPQASRPAPAPRVEDPQASTTAIGVLPPAAPMPVSALRAPGSGGSLHPLEV